MDLYQKKLQKLKKCARKSKIPVFWGIFAILLDTIIRYTNFQDIIENPATVAISGSIDTLNLTFSSN